MNAKKTLVVYYSRTGTTKLIAEKISALFNAEIEEVIDTKNRAGLFGYLRSGMDATLKRITIIKEPMVDPKEFDVIIIGTPIWNNAMSTPIRTYITQHALNFKNVAFFCTSGSGNNGHAFKDMEDLCNKKPITTIELIQEKVTNKDYESKLTEFAEKLSQEINKMQYH